MWENGALRILSRMTVLKYLWLKPYLMEGGAGRVSLMRRIGHLRWSRPDPPLVSPSVGLRIAVCDNISLSNNLQSLFQRHSSMAVVYSVAAVHLLELLIVIVISSLLIVGSFTVVHLLHNLWTWFLCVSHS